jgi:hypothetical protein
VAKGVSTEQTQVDLMLFFHSAHYLSALGVKIYPGFALMVGVAEQWTAQWPYILFQIVITELVHRQASRSIGHA